MKLTLPLLAGLFVVAPLGAQNIKINLDPSKPADAAKPAAKPATPAAAPAAAAPTQELIPPGADGKYTEVQKMQMYGFVIASELRMREQIMPMVGSQEEFDGFLGGVVAALVNKELPYDPKLLYPQTQEMVKTRMEVVKARLDKAISEESAKNKAEAGTFLATLDAKPGVKKTASGLRYEIIQEGKGPKAKPEQAVRCKFQTTFISGDVLASSKGQDGKDEGVEISLAESLLGLKEGLQLVGTGGKIKLYVPAELAMGDKSPFPGALTIFDFEILEVKEPTKQPAAPAAAK